MSSSSGDTMPRHASCGLDFPSVPNIKVALSVATDYGFSFTCLPIVHPRYKRELLDSNVKNVPFTRSDLMLGSQDWCNMVVGKLSDYINVDSENETFRKQSEEYLGQELMFCAHLGLSAVMINLHGMDHVNLARIIYAKTKTINTPQYWIRVPMVSPETVASAQYRRGENPPESDTWEWWNQFRMLCNSDKKIGLALELSADLPTEEECRRWLGEPLRAVIIPTSIFLTNRKCYPVLSQPHQVFIKRTSFLETQIILTGSKKHDSLKHYNQYIEHLYQNSGSYATEPYSRGFEDHLQIPLQPLMDNLESHTYEIFEKDPVKYTEYQNSIYRALLDRVPNDEVETNVQVVMVVGAGRGPLVTATLGAAVAANRKVRIYAVEKNPNAIVTLLSQKEEVWKDTVTVVACDMRDWDAPELCDILVSELLGSFGDNELSPECLDGPQKFLRPDGISIPSSYTSFLCPLQSHKLYNEARNSKPVDMAPSARFQMPYVVHQINTYSISPVQPLFTFHHPIKEPVVDHRRYKTLTFEVEQNCVLHGFSGYFEAVLYKDIKISIVPETFSKGMFSWFPIYFPIKAPLILKKGDELVVHFWRLGDKKNVWYEWSISKPVPLPIHNSSGRSYNIGLL